MRVVSKILIVVCSFWGCSSSKSPDQLSEPNNAEFALMALTVQNLEISTTWYANNLGFELDTTMAFPDYGLKINFLSLGEFRLELIGFDDPLLLDKQKLPTAYSNVHGLIKIGFLTNDLETIVSKMEASGAQIVAGPAELAELSSGAPWPDKFFLVRDPDGNYVQFFEADESFSNLFQSSGSFSLAPFLAMLSVGDFEGSKNWYEEMGFETIEGVDTPGNRRALLSQGNLVLEIGSFEDDVSIEQMGFTLEERDRIVRLNKLGLKINFADSLYAKLVEENYPFFYDHMTDDEPGFIIEDVEGNYVQFLKN